jgi:hypothetical protein
MTIKYRELMKEAGIAIDHPGLVPSFVSKVNTFEKKLAGNQMTDEEIEAADNELVELFKAHEISEDDSEEVKKANHDKAIAEGKASILEAETIEQLNGLKVSLKELPELLPLIDTKIGKLEKANQDQADKNKKSQHEAMIAQAKKEISDARYEDLQSLGEKYKDHPELTNLIKERHEKEKPAKQNDELKEKLLSKKEWSYKELKAMGITPTDEDMTIAGVRLEHIWLCQAYRVKK